MRMPFRQSPAPTEGNKSRKVHPQSSGLSGCGCPFARDQTWPKETKQEKCIRKAVACRDADALSPETSSDRRKQNKKSASAKQWPVGMRMPFSQSPDLAEGNKTRKVHPQRYSLSGCGCPLARDQLRPKETNQKKYIRICRYLQLRMYFSCFLSEGKFCPAGIT